tara:strand:+ start:311 stop:433 length:123 start_codon:yes stop_codon:yes gene_type:complete
VLTDLCTDVQESKKDVVGGTNDERKLQLRERKPREEEKKT